MIRNLPYPAEDAASPRAPTIQQKTDYLGGRISLRNSLPAQIRILGCPGSVLTNLAGIEQMIICY